MRIQNEVSKVKEALIIQEVLRQLQDEGTRADFLNGTNEAAKVDEADMALLDTLNAESKISLAEAFSLETLAVSAHKAAEHLVSTADGKPKSFLDTNYIKVRSVIRAVQDCGYFDRKFGANRPVAEEEAKDLVNEENEEKAALINGAEDRKEEESVEESEDVVIESTATHPMVHHQHPVSSHHSDHLVSQPSPQIQQFSSSSSTSSPKMHVLPIIGNHPISAPTVNDVEELYFKQQQQQFVPPPQLPPPSLPEVLETGAFFFLQESELDQPDHVVVAAPPPGVLHPTANPSPLPHHAPVLIMPVVPSPAPIIPINNSNPVVLTNGHPHCHDVVNVEANEGGMMPQQVIRPGVFPFFKNNNNNNQKPSPTNVALNPVQQLVETMSQMPGGHHQPAFVSGFGGMIPMPQPPTTMPSHVNGNVVIVDQVEKQQQAPVVEDQMKNISEWKDETAVNGKKESSGSPGKSSGNSYNQTEWLDGGNGGEKRQQINNSNNYNNENRRVDRDSSTSVGNINNGSSSGNGSWNNNDNNNYHHRRRYNDRNSYNNGGPRGNVSSGPPTNDSNGNHNSVGGGGGYRGKPNNSYMGHNKTYSYNRSSVGGGGGAGPAERGGNNNGERGGNNGNSVFYRNNDPTYFQNGGSAGGNGSSAPYKSSRSSQNMGPRPSGDSTQRRNHSGHREKNGGGGGGGTYNNSSSRN